MFEELNLEIREEVVRTLFHAEIEIEEADQLQQAQAAQALDGDGFAYAHESLAGSQAIAAAGGGAGLTLGDDGASVTAGALDAGGGSVMTQQRVTSEREKNLGRNDPCWCGSGKKFKRCHGA